MKATPAVRVQILIWSENRVIQGFFLEDGRAAVLLSGMPRSTARTKALGDASREYARWAKSEGRDERYMAQFLSLIRRLEEECGWETVGDMHAGAVEFEDYLVELQELTSAKTRNNALCWLRPFAEWLARRGEVPDNPFAKIRLNRHFAGSGSRGLSPPEMLAMIAVAEADEALPEDDRRCLRERSDWYTLSMFTGLRAKEMSLCRCNAVNFAEQTIELPAAVAKARKQQTIPLVPAALDWLRKYIGARPGDSPLMRSRRPRVRVVKSDAVCAKVAKKGETVGLHSFRKGFISAVAATGAGFSVTHKLARHSDPRTTEKVYVQRDLLPLRDTLKALVETGYGKNDKIVQQSAAQSDSMTQPRDPMRTIPSQIKSAEAATSDQRNGSIVADCSPRGLVAASCSSSSETCRAESSVQGRKWARQDSNLLPSLAAFLDAATDLMRRFSADGGAVADERC